VVKSPCISYLLRVTLRINNNGRLKGPSNRLRGSPDKLRRGRNPGTVTCALLDLFSGGCKLTLIIRVCQIGAALVSADGKLLGRGHNMRVQLGSAIHHVCFYPTPAEPILDFDIGLTRGLRARRRRCSTRAGCLPGLTRGAPCTRPCRPATCARARVCCTASRGW
jgi:hypothetical protein